MENKERKKEREVSVENDFCKQSVEIKGKEERGGEGGGE